MIGTTLSHYNIEAELGRGGMGVVYAAEDTRLGRTVALKFLPADLSNDEEAKARFIQEARAASALDHPNICTIYDIGESDDGRMFIAMSYYQGQTLKELAEQGPQDPVRAVSIACQLAEGLHKAHSAGIVHRDIKPANVMLTDEGRVVILDFGLAKLGTGVDLTKAGSTVGTTAYMGPEQASGQDVDERTDLWSLGVILYELLAGRRAFGGTYDQAVLYAVMNQDPEVIDGIDPALWDVVNALLAKDPSKRTASAKDAIQALRPFTDDSGSFNTSASSEAVRPTPSGFPATKVALSAVAAIVLLAVAWLAWPTGSSSAAENDGLVILPFSIQGGEELDYLHQGMVFLMSDKLDGLHPLRIVDPNTVVSASEREDRDRWSPLQGQSFASDMGQEDYLIGSITAAGTGATLSATLYHGSTARFTARSETSDVTELGSAVEDLARQILVTELDSDAEQLVSLTLRSSGTFEAVREYLAGVNSLRHREYREALAHGEQATSLDSNYALGYYLQGRANSWLYIDGRSRVAYLKAMEHADGLPPRVRRFLELELDPSESGYRQLLAIYPEMKDARDRLADFLYHHNPNQFRSSSEAIPMFISSLEEFPDNQEYASHLVQQLAKGYGPVPLDSVRHLVEDNAHYQLVTADETQLDSLMQGLTERQTIWWLPWETAWIMERPALAKRVVEAMRADPRIEADPQGFAWLTATIESNQALAEGRFADMEETLKGLPPVAESFKRVMHVQKALSPFLSDMQGELGDAVQELVQDADQNARLPSNHRLRFSGRYNGALEDVHWYLQGLAAVREGRNEEASAIRDRLMDRLAINPDSSFAQAYASRLEGYIMASNQQWDQALMAFNRGFRKQPTELVDQSWWILDAPARWERAQVLHELGRTEEAILSLNSIHDGYSWLNYTWLGPIYFQRGLWQEELGLKEDAMDSYRRFLELMDGADPIVDERKNLIQNRLNQLLSGEGT